MKEGKSLPEGTGFASPKRGCRVNLPRRVLTPSTNIQNNKQKYLQLLTSHQSWVCGVRWHEQSIAIYPTYRHMIHYVQTNIIERQVYILLIKQAKTSYFWSIYHYLVDTWDNLRSTNLCTIPTKTAAASGLHDCVRTQSKTAISSRKAASPSSTHVRV